jgi:hypothetical protein
VVSVAVAVVGVAVCASDLQSFFSASPSEALVLEGLLVPVQSGEQVRRADLRRRDDLPSNP